MTKKKHYVSHYVPVPREAFAGIMGTLMTHNSRSYWEDQAKRAGLADQIDALFSEAQTPDDSGWVPLDKEDLLGLAADLRSRDSAFSPPQVASIIAGDIDPSWKDE